MAIPKARIGCSALIRRLNRQLEPSGLLLRKSRGRHVIEELGEYFLVSRNRVARSNVDIERLAREHDCLEPAEHNPGFDDRGLHQASNAYDSSTRFAL
jgi:hypothetical protein